MGITPVKKTPSKSGRSPAHERRSQSKALKDAESPAPQFQRTPFHARESSFSHNLPTEEQKRGNGRVVGRSLIMWGRPRMAEKLLLHLHFECTRHKVNLPWDAIAHRLHPGSSGAAIVQHLNRVRKELIREGHLVPPICQKPSSNSNVDPTIRGYVRQDTESNDKDSTRPVRFDEKYDDLKFNLPDSFEHSGDEDYSMPDSPSPQRTRQLRYFSRPPSTTDESMTNSIHGMEQSWSPQSSTYCSPTRQRRADIEDYEVPALNRSFDTVTSVGSAPTSAPSMSNQWQELPWPQYSPMSLYPYSKDNSTVQSPFPGYFTLPSNFSMFPADDPMSAYREAQEARVASLRTYEETEGESPDAEKEDGDLKIETQFTNIHDASHGL